MSLAKILKEAKSPWLKDNAPDGDIVISSRIRLARNLQSFHFPSNMSEEQRREVNSIVKFLHNALGVPLAYYDMNDLTPLEKRVLIEKNLVTASLVSAQNSSILISPNEELSIMVNEEDHIRIQSLSAGLNLKEPLRKANEVDDALSERVQYAFHKQFGYLTSCPTNVGTGMRASAMLHLPALSLTKQISHLIETVQKWGVTVRGYHGEGSEALGDIYQISNQTTLGKSEEDSINELENVILQVINQERETREKLLKWAPLKIKDKIFRSLGVLTHARIIETREAYTCLSDIRFGVECGLIKDISRELLNELMICTQPGFLQMVTNKALKPSERDEKRATILRNKICKSSKEDE